jgi:beta propeller repeat protein
MKHLVTIFALLFFSIQLLGQTATTSITVLDPLPIFPSIPTVSGNTMAFVDYRNSIYSLYQVNLNTKQEIVASSNVGYTQPQIRISGDRVIWIGYPTTTQADVYVRNLSTSITTRITSDAAYQNFPDIQGDKAAWQDYRNTPTTNKNNADIYFYDFLTAQTKQITTNTAYQTSPSVWGNRIAWEDYRNAQTITTNADIYLYDVATNQEVQITSNTAAQIFPDIWEDKIVWEDYRNGVGDIYMYDLTTKTERAISTFKAYKTHPVIYGNWIVWQDYRNGTTQADLYGFDLSTNQEYPIIVQVEHQDFPQLDGLNLVWLDFRNGRQDIYQAILKNNSTTSVAISDSPVPYFTLMQNYPNPFNPTTVISYRLEVNNNVSLKVFDAIGREIAQLVNEEQNAGSHTVQFDGKNLSSGLYFYQLRSGNFVETKRMLLVK